MKSKWILLATLGLWITLCSNAEAISFGFTNISNNSISDAAIGEAQLSVDVTDIGSGQVLFTFLNIGSDASSITDVYFDDNEDTPVLSAIHGLIDADDGSDGDPGVDFSLGATPPILPAGNNATPPFIVTSGLAADSAPPVQPSGVNPGESLGVIFDLVSGESFADTISALSIGNLRVGIHVQGFASGGSESYVNTPNPVPEPATLLLFGTGVASLAGFRLRKKRK